ncbi:MAG: tyrosine-type recombinase/integrase [Kiritimatiellae bacterium]|nr:tyrosine-type recombinase/integrase [Kiritimatiellia bacterium]
MSVQVRRLPNGELASKYWYASFMVRGRRRIISTKVEVMGKPRSRAFVLSKGRAQTVEKQLRAEAQEKAGAEKMIERLVEIKTDERYSSMPLSGLAEAWATLPRKRKPSDLFVRYGRGLLNSFVTFLHGRYPSDKEMTDVSAAHVQAFMDSEEKRGVSARTWNRAKGLLRSVFFHLEPGAEAYRKYLAKTPDKVEDIVHRQPFTPEEIAAILEAAKDDDLMRPLIVTALCTAMRRGDCALLKWSSVDLKGGFLTVKTSKTGDTVEIPIMPLLRDELSRLDQGKGKGGGEYVFPEAARLYKDRPDVLNSRLKRLLMAAGFIEEDPDDEDDDEDEKKKPLPSLPPEELRENGIKAIESTAMPAAKRERFKAVFLAYTAGKTVTQVAAETGISSGAVSICLNKIESLLQAAVVRRKGPPVPAVVRGTLYSNGSGQRMKRGSLRGWHSFRTTFITLALTAGLPMELVRRVTGHTTVDVVLKHYFRPGREDFKRALQAAMPRLLTNGEKTPREQLIDILSNTSARAWAQDSKRALELAKLVSG